MIDFDALGYAPDHPWRALDPVLVRLLMTGTFPRDSYLGATVVLSGQAGDQRGAATGFVVQVGALPPAGTPDFFLVTARHVVLDAQAHGVQLEALAIRGYDSLKAVQDRVRIPLDPARWMHNDKSDISMMPFPVDLLPPDHNLTSIPDSELASRKMGVLIPQGADLAAYGRWSVEGGADIPIRRSVTLATFERPRAALEIGGARQLVEVYLADGTVSRGMSGGPVTFAGGGWANSAVIGLVHGYWPLGEADLATPGTTGVADDRAAILAEIRRQIGAVNSGVFFVVPIGDLEPLLAQAGFPFQPPRP
jgi:hypothetical protein